jgi:ribosomal protein S18 acetylase RimI-like enzyme
MSSVYKASYVSLHVRKSNKAAISLYRDALGFEILKVEKAYCEVPPSPSIYFWSFLRSEKNSDGDGEDAYSMRLSLKNEETKGGLVVVPA